MIHLFALTKEGVQLGKKVLRALGQGHLHLPSRYVEEDQDIQVLAFENSFKKTVEKRFKKGNQLLFIMATGIVVRTIGSLMKGKDTDPAVVVMDQAGQFVIPLLSGHLGGANEWATFLGEKLNAQPVITTATDVQKVMSLDLVAKARDCTIENLGSLAAVSTKLLDGEKVSCFSTVKIRENLKKWLDVSEEMNGAQVIVSEELDLISSNQSAPLVLRPPNLILGIGCRRDTTADEIEMAIDDFCLQCGAAKASIKVIVSVALKADEQGIIKVAKDNGWEFITYNVEQLGRVIQEEGIEESAFVKKNLGIGAVCQPAAIYYAKHDCQIEFEILKGKTRYPKITLSLVKDRSFEL